MQAYGFDDTIRLTIKSAQGTSPMTAQQPAEQGANAWTMVII